MWGIIIIIVVSHVLQMVGKLGYAVRNMIYYGQFCIYFNLMTYNIGFHNKIWSYHYYQVLNPWLFILTYTLRLTETRSF